MDVPLIMCWLPPTSQRSSFLRRTLCSPPLSMQHLHWSLCQRGRRSAPVPHRALSRHCHPHHQPLREHRQSLLQTTQVHSAVWHAQPWTEDETVEGVCVCVHAHARCAHCARVCVLCMCVCMHVCVCACCVFVCVSMVRLIHTEVLMCFVWNLFTSMTIDTTLPCSPYYPLPSPSPSVAYPRGVSCCWWCWLWEAGEAGHDRGAHKECCLPSCSPRCSAHRWWAETDNGRLRAGVWGGVREGGDQHVLPSAGLSHTGHVQLNAPPPPAAVGHRQFK